MPAIPALTRGSRTAISSRAPEFSRYSAATYPLGEPRKGGGEDDISIAPPAGRSSGSPFRHMRKPVTVHMKTLWLATAVLVLPAAGSRAAPLSGPDLLTACGGNATARATCDGYLMAVTDAVLQRESRAKGRGKMCVPDTVTTDQVRDSVMGFTKQPRGAAAQLGAAQSGTAMPALRLVTAAMRATWPCEDAPQRKGRSKRDRGQDQ